MRVRVTSCARPSRSISALHLCCTLLLLAAADTESKSVGTSHGLQAFGDFLQWQQLRHGIVTYNADARRQLLRSEQLQPLVRQYRIRFFGVSATPVRSFGANFYYSAPRVGVYLPELADVQLQRHVLQAGAADIFNNSQAWLLLTNECSASAVWENANRVLGALNISVSADITLAVKAKNDSLLFYDVYKACQNSDSQLEIEEKGLWSPDNGFTVNPKFRHGFISRRKNLCNITLRAGTAIQEKPANMSFMAHLSNSKDNLQLDPMQRKTYHLLKMLEPMFNVSFEVLFSDNWGSYINGSWNGVIARLLAHEVEFSICPMRFTPERIHLIQYTPELHTEFILFLFRHPRRNAIRNIFFEPFVNEVWFSVMALVVLVVLLLAVHVQHEFRQRQRQRQHQEVPATEPPLERRFDFVVLIILEAIFMQGPSPSMFGASSTRILILFTGVFSVMLLQFYSAFIVGSLLADAPRSITTLAALYNSSLEIGMENVSYNYEIFTNTTNPLAHEIYSRRICKNARSHILSMEQGAQRIGEGGFAFHVSVNRMYRILKANLTESEFCDLQEILLNPPYTASATLRKNSPYREHFAQAILHLRAIGLMQYNDRQWEVQKTDCSLNQNREVEVDLEHFIPALMFLASAMVISVAVLLLELCYSRLKRKWQQADGNANNLSEVNIKFQH